MEKKKRKTSVITIILLIIIIILVVLLIKTYQPKKDSSGFKQVENSKTLQKLYKGSDQSIKEKFKNILTLPVSLFIPTYDYYKEGGISSVDSSSLDYTVNGGSWNTKDDSKEYSSTNIQVENVDEADIVKTDGNYIYSLSENSIVITDVQSVEDAKIVSKFEMKENSIVQELLLYDDKLVAIGTENGSSSSIINKSQNTFVEVFDITNKNEPKSVKTLQIKSSYFTCRAIENNVYILASGKTQNYYNKSSKKIEMNYKENDNTVEIPYENMYYFEDINCSNQLIVAGIDLNNISSNANIKTYFINVQDAYVSENNIYVAKNEYEFGTYKPKLSSIFGFKGILGLTDEDKWEDEESGRKTTIYKFEINGLDINYRGKVKEKGQIVNQFSMDEYNENLRIAIYSDDGTKVIVYDKDMKKTGETENLAKGERMYSSRFIKDKAYLVTYKTVDPLYVIDLSDSKNPKALGELKIPGYSTYLHPYDENYIIGIGMETKETVRKDLNGKVLGTSSKIVGMKMALFDISDVNAPKQISSVVIGNSQTTSAVLTNHKALLFSKDKKLLAIPVNNYTSNFEISNQSEDIDDVIKVYTDKSNNFVSEGYEVYNIDTENGFTKKGTILHENGLNSSKYYTVTHLLRGMYIDDNLYTISENMIKINKLETLELLKEIRISSYIK